MKKVSYIVFGLFVLAVSSCQKEDIAPRKSSQPCASEIEWKSADTKTQGTDNKDTHSDAVEKASSGSSSTSDETIDDSGTSGPAITDPNNDPDSAKKKPKS